MSATTDIAQRRHPPGDLARDKVAAMLLDFFKTDETARVWFLGD